MKAPSKKSSLFIAVLYLAISMIATDAVAGLPTDQIKATVEKALVVLKDPRFKPPAKQQERRDQLKQILFARFDFAEMAK